MKTGYLFLVILVSSIQAEQQDALNDGKPKNVSGHGTIPIKSSQSDNQSSSDSEYYYPSDNMEDSYWVFKELRQYRHYEPRKDETLYHGSLDTDEPRNNERLYDGSLETDETRNNQKLDKRSLETGEPRNNGALYEGSLATDEPRSYGRLNDGSLETYEQRNNETFYEGSVDDDESLNKEISYHGSLKNRDYWNFYFRRFYNRSMKYGDCQSKKTPSGLSLKPLKKHLKHPKYRSMKILRRHGRSTKICQVPPTLQNFVLDCYEGPRDTACIQTCTFGHTMRDGIQRKMKCKYQENVWKPVQKFEKCRPFVDCTLEIIDPSATYFCKTGLTERGPVCDIYCGFRNPGEEDKQYECDIYGKWSPELPSCVSAGKGIKLVRAPDGPKTLKELEEERRKNTPQQTIGMITDPAGQPI